MNYTWLFVVLLSICQTSIAQNKVKIESDHSGHKLQVNGEDFIINGMNWDYFPIGTNYEYVLWDQPDQVIKAALNEEMTLLRDMGVNAIRQYTGIPPKWVTYIYKNYGIYTMLNHSFGRYGMTIDGQWVAQTDYGNSRVKDMLLDEVTEMVTEFKETPGLLFYLLGNENNYGLFWEGAETEDIPEEDDSSKEKAGNLYKLFNEATIAMKAIDDSYPIAICNGDLQFIEIIKKDCPDIDILGLNIYRGLSFDDTFQRIKSELGLPVVFTEFGSDAYDAIKKTEDQDAQAYFDLLNWKEIYENAAGMGKAGNALGGFTFQFTDGWWKSGQTKNLDEHDTNASWVNGGYSFDFTPGENNMNEEWFGICAKGETREDGTYQVKPRKAYFVLKEAHKFNPYSGSRERLEKHFSQIVEQYFKKELGTKGSD